MLFFLNIYINFFINLVSDKIKKKNNDSEISKKIDDPIRIIKNNLKKISFVDFIKKNILHKTKTVKIKPNSVIKIPRVGGRGNDKRLDSPTIPKDRDGISREELVEINKSEIRS